MDEPFLATDPTDFNELLLWLREDSKKSLKAGEADGASTSAAAAAEAALRAGSDPPAAHSHDDAANKPSRGKPKAADGGSAPAMTAEQRARRRERQRVAQAAYKRRVKANMASMETEVAEKRTQLETLLRDNLVLQARERVLRRAVEGGDRRLDALKEGSSSPNSSTGDDGGSGCSSGLGGGSAPPTAAAGGTPPGDSARESATPHPAAWGGVIPLGGGDPLLEGLLARLRGEAVPLVESVPRDVLSPIADRLSAFVRTYWAAEAMPAGPAADEARSAALASFRSFHSSMRDIFITSPVLRLHLRAVNMATLQRDEPAAGHYQRVVRASRPDTLGHDALLDFREMVRLVTTTVAKSRAQQAAILEDLRALGEAPGLHTPGSAAVSASSLAAVSERERYEELVGGLEAAVESEAAVLTTLLWGTSQLVSQEQLAHCYAESWPFFLDTWSAVLALVELTADENTDA